MPGDRPFPKISPLPARALALASQVWREIWNPLALGLLGLALAVTLSGYGYKLSLYRSLRDSSAPRIPVAKLWIEHRFGFAACSPGATSPRLKARVYAQPGASAVFAAAFEFPFQTGTSLPQVSAHSHVIPFFHAAIPLRSPPVAISL